MKKLLPLVLSVMFSSCATLFNGDFATVKLHVKKNVGVAFHSQTVQAQYAVESVPAAGGDSFLNNMWKEVYLFAPRSKDKLLKVSLTRSTDKRDVYIKPVHSWLHYANAYPFFWLGFLVDYNNLKRFSYPSNVYIDFDDTTTKGYIAHKPFSNYKWEAVINPPFLNVYLFNYNYVNVSGGPFGYSLGLNYHYKK
ncbi:MAG: hypothetical protein H7257_13955 [Taibaiella sp.]|nr:hypothetical protein [Taibaiella sp.]